MVENHRNLHRRDDRQPPDFLAMQASHRRPKVLTASGPKVACQRSRFQRSPPDLGRLDQVTPKHPGMVLLRRKPRKVPELIAAKWAGPGRDRSAPPSPAGPGPETRLPPVQADAMLDVLPGRRPRLPSAGIQENLADKARKLSIPVMKFDGGAWRAAASRHQWL